MEPNLQPLKNPPLGKVSAKQEPKAERLNPHLLKVETLDFALVECIQDSCPYSNYSLSFEYYHGGRHLSSFAQAHAVAESFAQAIPVAPKARLAQPFSKVDLAPPFLKVDKVDYLTNKPLLDSLQLPFRV